MKAKRNLICLKEETNPWNDAGIAIFAYFHRKPTMDELEQVFIKKYKLTSDEVEEFKSEACFEPVNKPDKLSRVNGTHRWFLCQAV